MMFGVFWILLHLDGLSPAIIGQAFGVILGSVLGRFFFQWMYDRTMSGSGYDIFRDYRLEIGERLKQAPMGYFSEQNLGTIQAMLTTTIADLEGYSMLAIEQMTSGVAMAHAAGLQRSGGCDCDRCQQGFFLHPLARHILDRLPDYGQLSQLYQGSAL